MKDPLEDIDIMQLPEESWAAWLAEEGFANEHPDAAALESCEREFAKTVRWAIDVYNDLARRKTWWSEETRSKHVMRRRHPVGMLLSGVHRGMWWRKMYEKTRTFPQACCNIGLAEHGRLGSYDEYVANFQYHQILCVLMAHVVVKECKPKAIQVSAVGLFVPQAFTQMEFTAMYARYMDSQSRRMRKHW